MYRAVRDAFRLEPEGIFLGDEMTEKGRVTTVSVRQMKGQRKIAVLTAYDYPMAAILDRVGIDIMLVGDTSGVVVAGYENTLPVTLDQTVYHTAAVMRGAKHALVVADLPFMSYQVSEDQAKANAGRVMKETNCQAVKLEGGQNMASTIKALTRIDIPVMGHVGLTPQSIHRMGGHKVQGRVKTQAEQIMADALAVEESGAFSIVLEGVPENLAREITEKISIPTIGIGAGRFCDGQVLVLHDMLGLFDRFRPKFVKQYANLSAEIEKAVQNYIDEVRDGAFPGPENIYE